jgi:hypothetical protein
MAWKEGFSWTEGYWQNVENPDKTKDKVWVHSGPFYFNPALVQTEKYRLEVYLGFRPTAPWTTGGNEGLWVGGKRLLQKIGWSNLGAAFRLKDD